MADNNNMATLKSTEFRTCSKCSVNSDCGLKFKCIHSICLQCLQNMHIDKEFINCNLCQEDRIPKHRISTEHSVLDACNATDHVLIDEEFVVKLTTKNHSGNTEYYEDLEITCKLTLPSSDPVVEKCFSVKDHQNGTYSLSGCCDVVGKWELWCYVNDMQIGQSALKVKVVKGGLQDYPDLFGEPENRLYMFDIIGNTIYACGGGNEITKFTLKGERRGIITGPTNSKFKSLCCADEKGVLSIVCYDAHTKHLMIHKKENWYTCQDVIIKSVSGKMTSYNGKVYVPDDVDNCVLCFSINGDLLERIEGTRYKKVNVSQPVGVVITKREEVLVLSRDYYQVEEFDKDRKADIWFENPEGENILYYPMAIAIDERGQIIISSERKLLLFNKEGKFIKNIENIEKYLPKYPHCIFSKNRRIWVADKYDFSLRMYNY